MHETITEGRAECYMGGVAVHPYTHQNPAAAGGVSVLQTCTGCGAQRRVNVNGSHVERAPWGVNRTERIVRARRRYEQARGSLSTETARHADGRVLAVSVDREGMICIAGEHTDAEIGAILSTLPVAWRATAADVAREYRQLRDLGATP
jgi:hypothetical protein